MLSNDFVFALKSKINIIISNISLNIKYSKFSLNFFSSLKSKAIFLLSLIYIIFVIVQLKIFSELWKPPSVTDLPSVKNYLSSYIYNFKSIKSKIDNRLYMYKSINENFAREISIPFHLNWMFRIQERMNKFYKKNLKEIKNFFLFNYHGRLVNYIPMEKKFLNYVYTYTPYLKDIFPDIKKKSIIYFYVDSNYLQNLYKDYIYKSKHYVSEPFLHSEVFNDYSKNYKHKYISKIEELFLDKEVLLPYLMFFTPLYNQNFLFSGIAGINIDINKIFYDIFKDNKNKIDMFVINEKGYLIYALNRKHIGEYVGENKIVKKILNSNKDILLIKKNNVFLKDTINNGKWILIGRINPKKITFHFLPNKYYRLDLFLFFGLELLLFIILYLLFIKYVVRPVNQISDGIKEVIKGNPIPRLYTEQNDEFKLIENRFNLMMDKIGGYLVFGKTMSQDIVEEFIDSNGNNFNIVPQRVKGTVLYIKIKNLNELKRKYSIKEFNLIMNKILNEIEITITKYKGYLDYYSSDAILAIFGIPLKRYNHIRNGYSAAVQIFNKIKLMNDLNNYNIKISISIKTGDIDFSQMQSNFGKLLVSLGDTIHIATLYDSIITSDVIAISEDTFKKINRKKDFKYKVKLKIRTKGIETIYLQKRR